MTINEIKELTRFLKEDEIDDIKKEIKSKETILKGGNIEEQELIQVLNTLFAILVIEKTLDSEIEEVEDIRDMLEQELIESYNIYDSYLVKCKKEDRKKKKWWLLDFLFLSDRVHSQKEGIGASNKLISNLKEDLNNLKEQKSDSNLKEVVSGRNRGKFNEFCDCPHKHRHPRRDHELSRALGNINDNKNQNVTDKINEKIKARNARYEALREKEASRMKVPISIYVVKEKKPRR